MKIEVIEKYLEKALKQAKYAYDKGNYPVGAVLLVNETDEVKGQNKVITEGNLKLHAEMDIINKSSEFNNTENKVIFVTMEPCDTCAKALVDFGVKRVYYIIEDFVYGGRDILEDNGIEVFQVKYGYEQYLDMFIDFITRTGNYKELLPHYFSIKENGVNLYKQQLTSNINNFFKSDNIEGIYDTRIVVLNNTRIYLEKALLRTPEDKHEIIINGYNTDADRIINYCARECINKNDFLLTEEFIKGLHRVLYPDGYIRKSINNNGVEFDWMIPGEYRNIELISNDNNDKNIYYRFSDIESGMKELINKFNNNSEDIVSNILHFLADFFIVHPFGDGNGRVAYILVDLLLLRNNLKPFYLGLIKDNDKVGFYKILDNVYETRDLQPMFDFIEKYS